MYIFVYVQLQPACSGGGSHDVAFEERECKVMKRSIDEDEDGGTKQTREKGEQAADTHTRSNCKQRGPTINN